MYTNYKTFEANSFESYRTYKNQFALEVNNAKGTKSKRNEERDGIDLKIKIYTRKLSFFETIGTFFQLCLASFNARVFPPNKEHKNDLKIAWEHLAKREWVRRLIKNPILVNSSEKKPNPTDVTLSSNNPAVKPVENDLESIQIRINATSEKTNAINELNVKSKEETKAALERNNAALENNKAALKEFKAELERFKLITPPVNLDSPKIFTPPKEENLLKDLREEYKHLPDLQKQQLREKVREISTENAYSCGRNVDFIKEAYTQMTMHSLTQKLFGPFKENLIFSLGQSPAWFTAMAQIDQPNPDRFSFVAFSGDWYGLFDHETGKELLIEYEGRSIARKKDNYIPIQSIDKNFRLKPIEKNKPTVEQITCYRSYLSRIGCTPQRLLEQKEPAVIVDYVQRAGGLKSFLEILFTWAEEEGITREQLKSYLIIQCMYDKATELLGDDENAVDYLQLNLGQYSASQVIAFPITEDDYSAETEGIRGLFAKAHTSISEQRRLIKRFTPSLWTEENCSKSSFAEYNGKVNEYILPIYANFINTVNKINAIK